MTIVSIGLQLSKRGAKSLFGLCSKPEVNKILSCGILGKAYRGPSDKPAPFPYREKNYNILRAVFDKTTDRFDENTKLIVVDGPIACGKTAFAEQLADELGMHYIPDANMDIYYINHYGYDMRQLDPKLPESCKSFDEKNFCMTPTHKNAAGFQVWMYRLRYSLYVDALAHILSTGQGVVIERSPFSDFVFMEAMFRNKYFSPEAKDVYYEIQKNTLLRLMRPHIVIYLDVPVQGVKDNIRKRNLPHEVQGKALTDKYLHDIDELYKRQYLPTADIHADVLVYDWSTPGDVEAVVEDLERMDFNYTQHDKKNHDWFKGEEDLWGDARRLYADQKDQLMTSFNIPIFDAPELCITGEENEILDEVWDSAPGNKYTAGFDPSKEKGLLFRTKDIKYTPF